MLANAPERAYVLEPKRVASLMRVGAARILADGTAEEYPAGVASAVSGVDGILHTPAEFASTNNIHAARV